MTFYDWLMLQNEREDTTGFLSTMLHIDPNAPQNDEEMKTLCVLCLMQGEWEILNHIETALNEYNASRGVVSV